VYVTSTRRRMRRRYLAAISGKSADHNQGRRASLVSLASTSVEGQRGAGITRRFFAIKTLCELEKSGETVCNKRPTTTKWLLTKLPYNHCRESERSFQLLSRCCCRGRKCYCSISAIREAYAQAQGLTDSRGNHLLAPLSQHATMIASCNHWTRL
jgi:hypothetical protein